MQLMHIERIKKIVSFVDKVLEIILISLMSGMVINVVWQVLSRYIFENPSTFTDELARYLLIWLGLLGASYVAGKQRHLAIDYFLNKLSNEKKRNLQVTIQIMMFIFAVIIMVIGGSNLVYHSFTLHQTSAALNINLGFIYMVLPLSGFLLMFYSSVNVVLIHNSSKK